MTTEDKVAQYLGLIFPSFVQNIVFCFSFVTLASLSPGDIADTQRHTQVPEDSHSAYVLTVDSPPPITHTNITYTLVSSLTTNSQVKLSF